MRLARVSCVPVLSPAVRNRAEGGRRQIRRNQCRTNSGVSHYEVNPASQKAGHGVATPNITTASPSTETTATVSVTHPCSGVQATLTAITRAATTNRTKIKEYEILLPAARPAAPPWSATFRAGRELPLGSQDLRPGPSSPCVFSREYGFPMVF